MRVLGARVEGSLETDTRSFVTADGRLDFERLLEEFAAFWREHGDVLAAGFSYHEVAPQLVLMAYVQRVVNGGGTIEREYGVGRGRIDLLVRWPHVAPGSSGGKRELQREAIELKVWSEKRPDPLARGLDQLDAYLGRLGLDHGTLVIFDRRAEAPPIESRTRLDATRTPAGRAVRLLRA